MTTRVLPGSGGGSLGLQAGGAVCGKALRQRGPQLFEDPRRRAVCLECLELEMGGYGRR